MSIFDRLKALSEGGFLRSVAVLAGGSAFAQAIALLVLPILTRLYSPDDFGALAVYVAVVTVLSSAACLRFEIAIPIADDDAEAIRLLVLSLVSTAFFSIAILLVILVAPAWTVARLGQPHLAPYMWLIPLGVFLAASYSAFLFLATRQKRFSLVARTRMSQTIGSAGVQLSMGVLGYAPLGLILGYAINVGAGSLGLYKSILGSASGLWGGISLSSLKSTFHKYSRYPKMSTLEALSNNAAIQVPVVIIAALHLGKEAGFLLLAMRVMQAPIGLVGQAISQVYFSRAPEEHRNGRLDSFTQEVLSGLIRAGVGPLCFIGLVAPWMFEIIFGKDWRRAGDLVQLMTPWFVFQFLASPLSMSLHVTCRQGAALWLQVFGLFLRVGTVLIVGELALGLISEAYVLSGAAFYFGYLLVILWAVSLPASCIFFVLRHNAKIIGAWLMMGMLTAFSLSVLIGQA